MQTPRRTHVKDAVVEHHGGAALLCKVRFRLCVALRPEHKQHCCNCNHNQRDNHASSDGSGIGARTAGADRRSVREDARSTPPITRACPDATRRRKEEGGRRKEGGGRREEEGGRREKIVSGKQTLNQHMLCLCPSLPLSSISHTNTHTYSVSLSLCLSLSLYLLLKLGLTAAGRRTPRRCPRAHRAQPPSRSCLLRCWSGSRRRCTACLRPRKRHAPA